MIGLDIPSHHGWKAKRAAAQARNAARDAKWADPEYQRTQRILAQHDTRCRLEVAIADAERETLALRDELVRAEGMVERIRAAVPASESRVEELRARLTAFEIQASADNAEAAEPKGDTP